MFAKRIEWDFKRTHVTDFEGTEMKLALCRTPYTKVYSFYSEKGVKKRDVLVPYSLLLLAGHVRRVFGDDVDVGIFDCEVGLKNEDELIDDLLRWKADLVGFTVTTPEIDTVLEIGRRLKSENPECGIILGGPHISGVKPAGDVKGVDYMVVGEGEYPLQRILEMEMNGKRNGSGGTVVLTGEDIDVNVTGDPDYSVIELDDYRYIDPVKGFVKANTVFTVRGCPYGCKFCFANRNYRKRNLDTVIAEVSYLYRHGVRQIVVNDETLTQDEKRFFDLTDRIMALGYGDLVFQGLTRADRITPAIAARLAEAGFRRMFVGVESGDDKILRIIGKNTDTEKIKRGVSLLREKGIIVRGSFILGLPYETHETIHETIEFAKSLDIQTAAFNIATPYPGTRLYDMALRRDGIEFTVDPKAANFYARFRRWGNCIVRTPALTSDDLLRYQELANEEFYSQRRIIDFYTWTFRQGNKERFWHRVLNHAYRKVYGKDVDYWNELE